MRPESTAFTVVLKQMWKLFGRGLIESAVDKYYPTTTRKELIERRVWFETMYDNIDPHSVKEPGSVMGLIVAGKQAKYEFTKKPDQMSPGLVTRNNMSASPSEPKSSSLWDRFKTAVGEAFSGDTPLSSAM